MRMCSKLATTPNCQDFCWRGRHLSGRDYSMNTALWQPWYSPCFQSYCINGCKHKITPQRHTIEKQWYLECFVYALSSFADKTLYFWPQCESLNRWETWYDASHFNALIALMVLINVFFMTCNCLHTAGIGCVQCFWPTLYCLKRWVFSNWETDAAGACYEGGHGSWWAKVSFSFVFSDRPCSCWTVCRLEAVASRSGGPCDWLLQMVLLVLCHFLVMGEL